MTLHAPKPQGTGWRAQKKAKERAKKREEKKRVALVEEGEGGAGGEGGSVGTRAGAVQGGRGRGRTRGRGRGGRGERGDRSADGGTAQLEGNMVREEPPAAVTNPNSLISDAGGVTTAGAEAQTATPPYIFTLRGS